MIDGFLIKKLDMTQIFNKDGEMIPVTRCQASPCVVMEIKKTNGQRVRLGAGQKKNANKPLKGLMKKSKLKHPPEIIREFGWKGKEKPKIGQKIKVSDVLSLENKVNVIGNSKGRGFTGVVKRWNFSTHPRTHGQKQRWRAPGSIGPQTPGRVIKGKKMPGHYGSQQVTLQKLTIVDIDEKNNQLLIKGGLPGSKGAWLQVIKNA
jgi:large subunit ribosomal protein L3